MGARPVAERRLDAEEQALWRRVTRDVRPLDRVPEAARPEAEPVEVFPLPEPVKKVRARAFQPSAPAPASRPASKPVVPASDTLDGGWDRRLRQGTVAPDITIDLHGYTLLQAHAVLEAGLHRAAAEGARVMLLVTGKPPKVRTSALDRPARGAIRAAVDDWLAGSRHAARIAAVRNAHPRHGGAGALYVILRRRREG